MAGQHTKAAQRHQRQRVEASGLLAGSRSCWCPLCCGCWGVLRCAALCRSSCASCAGRGPHLRLLPGHLIRVGPCKAWQQQRMLNKEHPRPMAICQSLRPNRASGEPFNQGNQERTPCRCRSTTSALTGALGHVDLAAGEGGVLVGLCYIDGLLPLRLRKRSTGGNSEAASGNCSTHCRP